MVESLQIERIATADLIPYARNSRLHSDAQVAQIAGSIREFGFCNPVLIDTDNGIIAGHGRVMAAQKLRLESVPCLRLSHLSDAQKRAYIIADNRLAETGGGWNTEMLALEIQDLQLECFDIDLTGFNADALNAMFDDLNGDDGGNEGLSDADDVPDLPDEPITKMGDVWLLGSHRIMCGDSTDEESVGRLMNGKKADLCLTDPPYGLGNTSSDKNNYDIYEDTRENLEKIVAGFLPLARRLARAVVLTPGNKNQRLYPAPDWTMAWFTPAGAGCGPWGFCCWQPILCYGKDPKLAKGKGSHPDAIVHTESAEKFGHPCTKPINFWKWLLERTSESSELIYEPFSGSGTTIVACEQAGRLCCAMELSPGYVDVAVKRWQDFTGQTAILESTGEPFTRS